MLTFSRVKLLKYGYIFIISIILLALAWSVGLSGYFNQLDIDELYHAQVGYLLHQGNIAFKDFYAFSYPPFFHYILSTVQTVTGFTLNSLFTFRYIMLVFFFGRILLLFFLFKQAFSSRLALIATFFLLFETFSTYTGMQIRPDSLMLLFFTSGLFFHLLSKKKQSSFYAFLSSSFYAASVAVLPKMVPVVICAGLLFIITGLYKKQFKLIREFILGAFTITMLTIIFFILQGNFQQVIQQMLVDSPKIFKNFQFAVFWGFYYRPDNPALYGTTGKPFSFVFSWLLLFMTGAGFLTMIQLLIKKSLALWQKEFLGILFLTFLTQFIWHLSLQSLFLQYYLSLTWVYVFFAAFAIEQLFIQYKENQIAKKILFLIVNIFVLTFSISIIQSNVSRSYLRSDELLRTIRTAWSNIPENQAVFPSVLYRPLGYIFPYKVNFADLPESFIAAQPDLATYLQAHNVKFISNDEYLLRFIPYTAQVYIKNSYTLSADGIVFIKKDE